MRFPHPFSRIVRDVPIVPFVLSALLFAVFVSGAVAAPAPDPTFGVAGSVRMGVAAGFEDVIYASAIQPDGKVVVAGISNGRTSYDFVTRFGLDGNRDPTFAHDGTWRITGCVGAKTPLQIEAAADGTLWLVSARANKVNDVVVVTRIMNDGGTNFWMCDGSEFGFLDPAAARGAVRMVMQPGGKKLFVADASADGVFALQLRRFATGPEYGFASDWTFGPNGEKRLDGLPANFAFTSTQLATAEPDGGVTLVANGTFAGSTYLVLRLTPDGALDPAFGNGAGYVSGFDAGNPRDVPTQIVRAPDGGYVVLGYPVDANGAPLTPKRIAWKLDASGRRVAAFGNDGTLALPDSVTAPKVNVLADGTIAVAGGAPETANLMLAAYDAVGRALSLFGAGGVATILLPGYRGFTPVGVHGDAQGRLHVAGWGYARAIPSGTQLVYRGADALVAAVTSAGAPRADYGGGDGFAVWNDPAFSNDRLDVVRFDALGRIVLAGYSDGTGVNDYLLTRLGADGALDPAYGTNGRTYANQSARFIGPARAVMRPDESVVVASGEAFGSFGTVWGATMFRATANGAIDPAFAPSLAPAGPNAAVALGTRPDGRVVYGTIDAGHAVLQQFLADGAPDPAFGSGGRAAFPIGASAVMQGDLAVLPDGSVVLAVFVADSVRVLKVDARGALDSGFGAGGQVVRTRPRFQQSFAAGPSLLALADGTLLAATRANVRDLPGELPIEGLYVLRLSANGAVLREETVLQGQAYSTFVLAALPDSSVIVARNFDTGFGGSRAFLNRLLPDGNFDRGFGMVNGTQIALMQVNGMGLDAAGRLVVSGQDRDGAVVARYVLDTFVSSVPVIEYYNTLLGHYFVTGGPGEIASIESGGAGPGWQRTGYAFTAYVPESGVGIGALPVCRFYGTPGIGPNSHFYTVDAAECEAVKHDPGWTYEGTAFFIAGPIGGACAGGTTPVYRAYNNRFAQNDSNHRYATDSAVYDAMVAQGWSGEGIVFCAP